jgi:putative phosphonate catabolism associated alcohol dehydrogenase
VVKGAAVGRTARAAVFEGPGQPLALREYPLVEPGPGELLVRVRMSTICRSDLHSWEGKRPSAAPGILGHEIVGVIEAMGDAVGPDLRGARLRAGDRVTWTLCVSCGACYYCRVLDMPQKCVRLRKYGHETAADAPHLLGGFAEYCYLLAGTGVLAVPDELADEEAAPLNCGVATMMAATEAVSIGVGDAVVVQGVGLLGLYGIAIARGRGARQIVGLDAVEARLEAARRFGADAVVNVAAMDGATVVRTVREICPPDGPDAVIEAAGVPAVLPQGLQMLRKGGRYAVAGIVSPGADVSLDASLLVSRWITVRGVHNYHPRHLVQALDFVQRNRKVFPLAELVEARFALREIDTALAQAAARRVLRAAIVP